MYIRLDYWQITGAQAPVLCSVSVSQNYGFMFFIRALMPLLVQQTLNQSPIFLMQKFTTSPDMLKSKYSMCYMNNYKCQQLPAIV